MNGWGTLCGALNGSAAAFQVLSAKPEPLIDALFGWYEREALANYVPRAAKFPNVTSVAGSPLCHASIAAWCKAAGKQAHSPERKERCGVIAAAVARHAVVLLNAQAAGRPFDAALAGPTAACMACHEKGGALEDMRSKLAERTGPPTEDRVEARPASLATRLGIPSRCPRVEPNHRAGRPNWL